MRGVNAPPRAPLYIKWLHSEQVQVRTGASAQVSAYGADVMCKQALAWQRGNAVAQGPDLLARRRTGGCSVSSKRADARAAARTCARAHASV
mmetsp:Transcript_18530/g.39271  ORF Transcript_18530/g.39271 Transcript_18530/m.39271 type:complete len:92 (-) Transcript_18530:2269-2544(-)